MKRILCIIAVAFVATGSSLPWESAEEQVATRAASTCECGWTNKGRIVGGSETGKNQYPLMVPLLKKDGDNFCGGTIITSWHIITAAHCTHDKKAEDIFIRVGTHDLSKKDGVLHGISRIINHELFNPNKNKLNDIALLLTQKQISFNQNVGPACLPATRHELEFTQVLKALGWGRVKFGGEKSPVLKAVDLRIIDWLTCYRFFDPDKVTNLCSYDPAGDTCNGDSGGPLIWLNPTTNRYTLEALVSYGGVCGSAMPAVNTNVFAFLDWIKKNIAASKPGVSACIKG